MRTPSGRNWRSEGLSLHFGGVMALGDIDLSVRTGELFAVIGPNGAGKTSLLNCITGFYRPQEGRILFNGRDITHLASARTGPGRHRPNISEYRALSRNDGSVQPLSRPPHPLPLRSGSGLPLSAVGPSGGDAPPADPGRDHRFSGNPVHPQQAGRLSALRDDEAGGTGTRPGPRTGPAGPGRTLCRA